jgi:hypothetical protein
VSFIGDHLRYKQAAACGLGRKMCKVLEFKNTKFSGSSLEAFSQSIRGLSMVVKELSNPTDKCEV